MGQSAPLRTKADQNDIRPMVCFVLDGKEISAPADESLWTIAKREGTTLPHLCYADEPGYRSDGNCRACMVEIEGERVLAASCIRTPSEGMVVNTQSNRAKASRNLVVELLLADQPEQKTARDQSSHLWSMASEQGVTTMPAAAIDEAQVGDSKAFDEEVKSVCPYCGVGCQVSYKIRDQKIAWVDGINGPANEQRLCVKGRFGFDYIAHKHRLTTPMIRREDAPPKGLNVNPGNLSEFFREATWDEALDYTTGKMGALRDSHGGEAVAGFGSAKCSNEEAYLFQKLIRLGFGHNNVDHCTRLCHASSVSALLENVGSAAVTATFNEIENADCAIVIGANPVENHPVAATYFKQFAKRGGKLIVMDPRGMGLSRFATHNLKFKPGSDVAMLNAIMHTIVDERLYDRQYMKGFTEGFDEMVEHLQDFPPEKMADICGIDAETLKTVAPIRAKRA